MSPYRQQESGSCEHELRTIFYLQPEHFPCASAVSPEPLIDFESVLRCIRGHQGTWQSNQ